MEVFETTCVLLDVPLKREHAVAFAFEASENAAGFGSAPGIRANGLSDEPSDRQIAIPDPPCDIKEWRRIARCGAMDRSQVAVQLIEGKASINLQMYAVAMLSHRKWSTPPHSGSERNRE